MRDHQTEKDSFKVGLTFGTIKLLVEGVGRNGMYAALLSLLVLLAVGLISWIS